MVYCIIVVISPLKYLKDKQVNYLNNIEVPPIAIGDIDDPNIIQQVMNGNYVVVYGFPECLLSTPTWRGIFADPDFKEKTIAIDEAYCITQWYVSPFILTKNDFWLYDFSFASLQLIAVYNEERYMP